MGRWSMCSLKSTPMGTLCLLLFKNLNGSLGVIVGLGDEEPCVKVKLQILRGSGWAAKVSEEVNLWQFCP